MSEIGQCREIIETPNDLTDGNKKLIAEALTPITARGFMREVNENLYQDVYRHVFGCDRLTIVRDSVSRQIGGFLAISIREFDESKLLHLEGIIIEPHLQHTGVSLALLKLGLVESESEVIALHTQNKAMMGLAEKVSDYDRNLSLKVADLIGTTNLEILENENPIDKGRYGNNSLYGEIDRFSSFAVQMEGFDAFSGDAVIFAGYVKEDIC